MTNLASPEHDRVPADAEEVFSRPQLVGLGVLLAVGGIAVNVAAYLSSDEPKEPAPKPPVVSTHNV